MNALVGQKAKANCSLLWLIRTKGTNDDCRKDGSDFASTGAGGHTFRRRKFAIFHEGLSGIETMPIVA